MNYVGIGHHRQYSHLALSITIFSKLEREEGKGGKGKAPRRVFEIPNYCLYALADVSFRVD